MHIQAQIWRLAEYRAEFHDDFLHMPNAYVVRQNSRNYNIVVILAFDNIYAYSCHVNL